MGDKPIAAVYPGNRIVNITASIPEQTTLWYGCCNRSASMVLDPDVFGVAKPSDSTTGLPNGVIMNLRFLGQYYDQKSGLYYNHNLSDTVAQDNPELG